MPLGDKVFLEMCEKTGNAVNTRDARIKQLEAENARMRAALNQLTDEGVDDWIAALAKIALDGNTTLST